MRNELQNTDGTKNIRKMAEFNKIILIFISLYINVQVIICQMG